MKYLPQGLPLKGLVDPQGVEFLPINCVVNAASRQRESRSSGNPMQMTPGALEHQAELPEGIICLVQNREGKISLVHDLVT